VPFLKAVYKWLLLRSEAHIAMIMTYLYEQPSQIREIVAWSLKWGSSSDDLNCFSIKIFAAG